MAFSELYKLYIHYQLSIINCPLNKSMEQIIITKADGSTVPLQNKQTATSIKSAVQDVALLDQDVVRITVESPFKQTYAIGDTIRVFGRLYKMNRLPKVSKTGAHRFSYDLEYEGGQYDLARATYDLTIDTTSNALQDVQSDALVGDLERFATVLLANANRVMPGRWLLGDCPETVSDKLLSFSESDNCLSVLQTLCAEFETEFDIEQMPTGQNKIHFRKSGQILPFTFAYGKGKGVYRLDRQNVSSSNIITRLKVFGATKNITHKYRAQRLCLPGKTKGASYIEKPAALAKYGVWEATKYFDDIFPSRTGLVSALGNSVLKFVDAQMFDLNAKEADGVTTKYLLDGVTAKIRFITGNLAGYEFDIAEYNHGTKTFKLVEFKDERDSAFPSNTSPAFQIAVGDQYKLLDIALPPSYEADAENRLANAGETYYQQNSQPKVQYSLELSEDFLRKIVSNGATTDVFHAGDYLHVLDDDIGVDKSIRVSGFRRDLINEYSYSLTLSDVVSANITSRVISELNDVDTVLRLNRLKDPTRARANWRSSRELLNMVFDPDGDYYTEKIKPNSIDTLALSVGAKAMQFGLTNTVFQPNYNGNKNLMRVEGGVLTHYTIDADAARSWMLANNTTTFSADATAYYIYAKCERVGQAGAIIFSPDQTKTEEDANYYHFWIGVVHSVDAATDARSVALSYGFTTVNGGFIRTGRIASADGNTYFDLDSGEIGGRIVFSSNGQAKTLAELGADSLEAKNYINNTLPALLGDFQSQLDGQIEQFFEPYDPTPDNAPANTWTTPDVKDKHLSDLFYNTNTGKVFRWIREPGPTSIVYKWQELQDSEVATALALANDALALADDKRRIFTTTPKTPYDMGDLWVQGASGGILRCKTSRLGGAYSSSDWEPASKYTDDAALNNFVTTTYDTQIDNLINQIDGKIESWFQTADPAAAWTTAALKKKHVGDMWYDLTNKFLYRYSTSYTWVKIEDKKAIDAYTTASQAKNLADSKRQVFIATPVPPYAIGDLWVNGVHLRRCAKAKAAGQSYHANDWVIAVSYDNTKTTIQGGIVTSGTIQLAGITEEGTPPSILAGITGEGTAAESVRLWAGASFENRGTAPFRVLQDGSVVMNNATVSGTIFTSNGTIGGFNIKQGFIGYGESAGNHGLGLLSDFIKFSDQYSWAGIGTNTVWAGATPRLARFEMNKNEGYWGEGIALYTKARFNNDANDNQRIRRAISSDGNVYSIGKHALFHDGYSGPVFSNVIVNNIGVTHTYHFTSIPYQITTVYLPSRSQIRSKVGNRNVTFFLFIQVGSLAGTAYNNRIRVRGVYEGYIIDNDVVRPGGGEGWFDMARGDSLLLFFAGVDYHIVHFGRFGQGL